MSSVSSTSSSSVSNGRYWGLASGLDVDSIVTALVSDEQEKIDKVKQQQQTLQWQQSAYQTVISDLQAFQDAYLSISGSSSMLKSSSYITYAASSSNSAVTAKATADASGAQQTIKVLQSATTASVTGGSINGGAVSGTISDLSAFTSSTNPSFTVTVDGTSKTISFTSTELSAITSEDSLRSALQTKLVSAFGTVATTSGSGTEDKVQVSGSGSTLSFSSAAGYSSAISVSTSNISSSAISFTQTSNRVDTSKALSSLPSGSAYTGSSITINNTSISISSSDTIASIISKVNSSGAGVTLAYNSTTDQFSMTSNTSGASGSISFNDASGTLDTNTSNFLTALGITAPSNGEVSAQDANVGVSTDGGSTYTYYSRSSNNFTIGGVNYTINGTVTASSPQTAAITMTQDTSTLETNVKNFVTAYNNLITTIYNYTDTKPDADYPPLTDAQKADMTTDQITAWNKKAQQGILFSDNTLEGVADNLRSALYQSVTLSDGNKVSLYNFGITTSDDPDNHGTLVIDQNGGTDFENALANNISEFQEFFTKTSSIALDMSSDANVAQQSQRTSDEGLISKISDIIERASGSGGGSYGSLLLIAGATSGTTQYSNYIYSELQQLSSQISDLNTEMSSKKNRLYSQFTALETFMQEANSESSTLTSMLSGN